MEKRIYNIMDQKWEENRRNGNEKIFGKLLVPKDLTEIKITETKVEPGGIFHLHVDAYHHVLYFISGFGVGWIGEESYEIKPGVIVNIPAGEKHGYKNTRNEDIILLTINIPNSTAK
ncbi:MAG: cupin domain-containing protein [Candidatus Thorarchaeota archaeon]